VRALEAAANERDRASQPAASDGGGPHRGSAELEALGTPLPINLFAFGDVYYRLGDAGRDGFAIGQAELDLEMELAAPLSVSVSVAYDSATQTFGLGGFAADGRWFGKDEHHLFRTQAVETSGVLVGLFDVPFGIAYLEYPSVENRLVTQPSAVEATHGGWSDLGVQAYVDLGRMNAVAWFVNGYAYVDPTAPPPDPDPANPDAEVSPPLQTPDYSVGARLGAKPAEALELGASYAAFLVERQLGLMFAGADVQGHLGQFALKAEYILQCFNCAEMDDSMTHGAYALARYDVEPAYATARYSAVWAEGQERADRLSGGLGVHVFKNARIQSEVTFDLEREETVAFLQVVGGSDWQPTGFRR
jgi:hypothetical protein